MKGGGLISSFLLLMMMICAAFASEVARGDLEDVFDNDEALDKRSTCRDIRPGRWCQWYRQRGYCARNNKYYGYFKTNCAKTCAACKSSNGVEKVNVNINECLRAHNSKRALHGARPLTWDPNLARQAQAYAVKLAEANSGLVHDPNRGFVGENLQYFSTYPKIRSCKDAVDEWYSEVEMYPFSNPDAARRNWGLFHFTQVVWKKTKHLGVGIAKNRHRVYIVARYTPPGNYGSFAENVGNIRRG